MDPTTTPEPPDSGPPAEKTDEERRRGLFIYRLVVVAIAAFVVVGVGGFAAGFKVEQTRVKSDVKKARKEAVATAQKKVRAANAPAGPVVGKVKSMDQGSVTITRANGKDLKILTTGARVDTTTNGTLGDITQGATIMVQGDPMFGVGIDANGGEILVLPDGSKFGTRP